VLFLCDNCFIFLEFYSVSTVVGVCAIRAPLVEKQPISCPSPHLSTELKLAACDLSVVLPLCGERACWLLHGCTSNTGEHYGGSCSGAAETPRPGIWPMLTQARTRRKEKSFACNARTLEKGYEAARMCHVVRACNLPSTVAEAE
jgi:hypothetical protein